MNGHSLVPHHVFLIAQEHEHSDLQGFLSLGGERLVRKEQLHVSNMSNGLLETLQDTSRSTCPPLQLPLEHLSWCIFPLQTGPHASCRGKQRNRALSLSSSQLAEGLVTAGIPNISASRVSRPITSRLSQVSQLFKPGS